MSQWPVARDVTVTVALNVNSVTVQAGMVNIQIPKSALTVVALEKSVAPIAGEVDAAKLAIADLLTHE